MNELSLVTWIRTSTLEQDHVVSKGTHYDYQYALRMGHGLISVVAWQNAGAGHLDAYSTTTVNDYGWRLIVGIIRNGISAEIYVDGDLSGRCCRNKIKIKPAEGI